MVDYNCGSRYAGRKSDPGEGREGILSGWLGGCLRRTRSVVLGVFSSRPQTDALHVRFHWPASRTVRFLCAARERTRISRSPRLLERWVARYRLSGRVHAHHGRGWLALKISY